MQSRISVDEAARLIHERARPLEPVAYPLLEALGLVLAEAPLGDVDMPPFDKSAVDGVALRSDDAVQGAQLSVVDELLAGSVPMRSVMPGEAIRIMTGAPVPPGADAVVKVEHLSESAPGAKIELLRGAAAGDNICRRGEDVAAGSELLPCGTRVEPHHVGLLAGQGCVRLVCYRRPRVAVLATGSELVPANTKPGPGQIRNSNSISTVAAVLSTGALGHDLGLAVDDEQLLRAAVRRALTQDVVLLSGGVSAGVRDLVPDALAAEGVEPVFHHVTMQPGRPVLYGVKHATHVFGLPGNPVSAFVCFEVLVRPLLRRLMGAEPAEPRRCRARWAGRSLDAGGRTRFVGISLHETDRGLEARAVESRGSADLMGLARSKALAVIHPQCKLEVGQDVEVLPLDQS
jgi:molybdopterin molybdotransferase